MFLSVTLYKFFVLILISKTSYILFTEGVFYLASILYTLWLKEIRSFPVEHSETMMNFDEILSVR